MPETVAVTCTVPVPAGLVAVQLVVEAHETPVAAVAPNCTVVAPGVVSKPVPVMVTTVPPTAKPLVGSIAVTIGVGHPANLNEPIRVFQLPFVPFAAVS